ncbi:MAG: YfcE family phosphodiesterase [Methanomassiliicoccales archaeon]|nr:YfcE family phosphodiesterase [Methanomassiliicoccales archaeon]
MLIAFISDIHANVIAFDAVLKDIEKYEADAIICAGDIVGYYPYPNETIERVASHRISSIVGNHDRAVVRINPVGMNRMAAEAILWTAKNIKAEYVDYLRSLRSRMTTQIDDLVVGVYHGSPRDDDEYLYEIDATEELLEMSGSWLVVTGHTHIPFIKKMKRGMIINAGSVGQPRDSDPRASYILFDSSSREAWIRRVEYDFSEVERKVREAGLPQFLGERLKYGF